MADTDILPWPTSEGYWMGALPKCGTWFPLHVMGLKSDLPGDERIIGYVAKFPESQESWPYLFSGNHPIDRWRLPTPDEMVRIKHFYGQTQPVTPTTRTATNRA